MESGMGQEVKKSLEITTDGVWHELRTRHELPLAAQKEFDYAPESDEPRFVLVGDDWYDAVADEGLGYKKHS